MRCTQRDISSNRTWQSPSWRTYPARKLRRTALDVKPSWRMFKICKHGKNSKSTKASPAAQVKQAMWASQAKKTKQDKSSSGKSRASTVPDLTVPLSFACRFLQLGTRIQMRMQITVRVPIHREKRHQQENKWPLLNISCPRDSHLFCVTWAK